MDIELAQALEENKNLRDNYEQYKATAELTIKELQQKIDSLQGYLDHDIEYDIEQENLKLKAYNEKLNNRCKKYEQQISAMESGTCTVCSEVDKELQIEKLQAYNEKLLDSDIEKHNKIVSLEAQIEEAKDLIRNLLRVTYGEGWNYSLDWKVKAEKFLRGE